MSSPESTDGGGIGAGAGGGDIEHGHVVELVASTDDSDSISEDHITPLLPQSDKSKINIFSVSYARRKPNKDQMTKLVEMETSPFTQFLVWTWSGSRYSGLLCMALSSCIYCIMEVLSDSFSVQSISLFELAFARCSIIKILSSMWSRRSGQPIFGPTNVRNLFASRALTGCISLLTFVYCKTLMNAGLMSRFQLDLYKSFSS